MTAGPDPTIDSRGAAVLLESARRDRAAAAELTGAAVHRYWVDPEFHARVYRAALIAELGQPADDVGRFHRDSLILGACVALHAELAIDVTHLARQARWSARTFGPGSRKGGVSDHIRKELDVEVREGQPDEDPSEWIDVIILAFDGAWRSGLTPEQIIAGVKAKQAKNEARTWPDWRTAEPGKAIEHDRSVDGHRD